MDVWEFVVIQLKWSIVFFLLIMKKKHQIQVPFNLMLSNQINKKKETTFKLSLFPQMAFANNKCSQENIHSS